MQKFWFVVASIAVSLMSGQRTGYCAAPVPDPLEAVHVALFSSFLPVDAMRKDAHVSAMFRQARQNIWSYDGQAPEFRRLLAPFADLHSVGDACGVATYAGLHSQSFASLSAAQRQHVLYLLQSCDQNDARRLAMTARNFYLAETYGRLQEQLTNISMNPIAPHPWIQQHYPKLAPTRLRLDREKHEIVATGGPIDYLIVGSGPAGSVLAHELRRGGKRVVLVERGSFVVPGSMETRRVTDLLDARTSDDGGIRISNGMAVGGGSQVNVDLCFAPTTPAIQAKIAGWRKDGRIGPDDFTTAQLATAYAWVKAAIGTRTLSQSEINANNRVLWDGAVRDGLHPSLYDLNTYAPGKSPYPETDKRSAESELLMEALTDSQNPLGMIPDADVRRVLFEQRGEDRTAIGVEIRTRKPISEDGVIADPNSFGLAANETVTIHALHVILSAGALGSPTILLRSKVENPQIGRGAILHPSMPIIAKFDHTIDALEGTQASVYVGDHLIDRGYAFESMSAPPVYAAVMSMGSAMHTFNMVRSFHKLAGFGVMLVDTPSPENRLVLDEQGEPKILYQLSEPDKQRLRQGVAEAVRMMILAGAKQVYLPSTEDVPHQLHASTLRPVTVSSIREADLIERDLQFIPNRGLLTSAHMQATDKMGADPSTSVVATDFHVWGTKGLYVVDGSIFPTSIGANPMQSIYTFAKIFADRVNASPDLRPSILSVP
jgi:choline dehydrogenase-like flavoprotein